MGVHVCIYVCTWCTDMLKWITCLCVHTQRPKEDASCPVLLHTLFLFSHQLEPGCCLANARNSPVSMPQNPGIIGLHVATLGFYICSCIQTQDLCSKCSYPSTQTFLSIFKIYILYKNYILVYRCRCVNNQTFTHEWLFPECKINYIARIILRILLY